jgi:two-component system KDP operon response regulator KdpE
MTGERKILIVDDERAIRRLLVAAVERAGYRVVEAENAREALSSLQIDKPEAVLLDLGLPDRDGMELVPLMRAGGAAVLVISAREATDQKVTALDLGADDYVTKPFDTEEVLARIRGALRHRLSTGTPVVTAGNVTIDLLARRVTKADDEVHLTPKEYAVLAELAKHPGRVLTHSHLLRTVWGPAHEGQIDYLRVAVRALRLKLERDPSRPELIVNEPAVGYRLKVN